MAPVRLGHLRANGAAADERKVPREDRVLEKRFGRKLGNLVETEDRRDVQPASGRDNDRPSSDALAGRLG